MDEKKKLIVVGVLVAVIACVGAFQFLGGSSAPAPAPAPATTAPEPKPIAENAKKVEAPSLKNPAVANDLPARDPFLVPASEMVQPAPPPKAPVLAKLPKPSKRSGDRGFQPLPLGGNLPTISKLPGTDTAPETLPSSPAVEAKPFGYKVVGTIGGVRPAVVMEDSAGNQKLVPVGSAVDGDSRVRSVAGGTAIIDFRGKKLRLTVGGNPSGK